MLNGLIHIVKQIPTSDEWEKSEKKFFLKTK